MMPFDGGVENLSNGSLILSVIAALLFLRELEQPQSWKRSVVKTFSVLLLVVIAAHQNGPALLVAGLGLSALGDYFLSREGDRNFLAGLGSFLAAHAAYVALFYGAGAGLAALTGWKIGVAIALVAQGTGMLNVLLRRVEPGLKAPILAYVAAILLMGLSALMTNSWMVIAGALLFMASDTILAWEKFVEPRGSIRSRPMRVAVWVLYYAAQMLIMLGFVLG